jgi:hypothetical protein
MNAFRYAGIYPPNRRLFTNADFIATEAKMITPHMQIQVLKKLLTSAGPVRTILQLTCPPKDIYPLPLRKTGRNKYTNFSHDTTAAAVITGSP